MVRIRQSSQKLYETVRLNSMEEDHRYKVIVAGSNPAVATKLVRNSIGLRVPVFYTGSSGFEMKRSGIHEH